MKSVLPLLYTIAILVGTTKVKAQTYSTGFDNTTEQMGWQLIKKGDTGSPYFWEYDQSTVKSAPNCLSHYYPVGGSVPTDNWFVSPMFSFLSGGSIDSLWRNYSGFGTPMAGDTVALYLLVGNADPDLATSKMFLRNFADTSYHNDNIWREEDKITIAPTVGDCYIAFRYKTTNNWLDVKFDNLQITHSIGSGIPGISNNSNFQVYPNPFVYGVSIKLKSETNVKRISVIDMEGKEVLQFPLNTRLLKLNTLPKGQYFVQVQTDEGQLVEKIIKN